MSDIEELIRHAMETFAILYPLLTLSQRRWEAESFIRRSMLNYRDLAHVYHGVTDHVDSKNRPSRANFNSTMHSFLDRMVPPRLRRLRRCQVNRAALRITVFYQLHLPNENLNMVEDLKQFFETTDLFQNVYEHVTTVTYEPISIVEELERMFGKRSNEYPTTNTAIDNSDDSDNESIIDVVGGLTEEQEARDELIEERRYLKDHGTVLEENVHPINEKSHEKEAVNNVNEEMEALALLFEKQNSVEEYDAEEDDDFLAECVYYMDNRSDNEEDDDKDP